MTMVTNSVEKHTGDSLIETYTGYDYLNDSWVGKAGKVPDGILHRLGETKAFQRHIGLLLLAQSPDAIDIADQDSMLEYVMSDHAASDVVFNAYIWNSYKKGQYIHPITELKSQETFLTAELKLRALLRIQLLNIRGYGYSIETLAEKFMRFGQLEIGEGVGIRFRDEVPRQMMKMGIRTSDGELFFPNPRDQSESQSWDADGWLNCLKDKRDLMISDKESLARKIQSHTLLLRDTEGHLFIPGDNGLRYTIPDDLQEVALRWNSSEWIEYLRRTIIEMNHRDEAYIREEIKSGRQPFVKVEFDIGPDTPIGIIPNWGYQLRSLSPEQILALADRGLCAPDCATYHGEAKRQKELGELIAPVDAQLFASELRKRYVLWKEHEKRDGQKFSVLIPAQADETTIIGILDQLKESGIGEEELKENFSLVLADLCPTPLLRIYAALKKRDLPDIDDPEKRTLLDIANIVCMDVFNWADPMELKFSFIATDHFVDLFPEDGPYNQTSVLTSLIEALAPSGELVLTARCGTDGHILTKESVMEGFTARCLKALENLTRELERADSTDGELYEGIYKDLYSTKQDLARGIYALAAYLTLRDVNPFSTTEGLATLLSSIQQSLGTIEFTITPLAGKTDKVSIKIVKIK